VLSRAARADRNAALNAAVIVVMIAFTAVMAGTPAVILFMIVASFMVVIAGFLLPTP
jgi:hypothetical protein